MTSAVKTKICFVADRWCLDLVTSAPPDRFRDILLVPLKHDILLALQQRGMACFNVFEYLSDDAIRGFFVETERLSEGWFSDLQDDCKFRGHTLPVLDKLSMYCFFHDAAFIRHVVNDSLDRNPALQTVALFPNLRRPQELYRPATDIATGIARWIAEARGLSVELLDGPTGETVPILPLLPRLPSDKVPPRSTPAQADATGMVARIREMLGRRKKRPKVLIVLEGLTGQVGPQLGRALAAECDVTFATTWLTWEEMEALSEIGELLPIGLPYRLSGDAFRDRFASARKKISDQANAVRKNWPEIFNNPHLSHQFDSLMTCRWPEICEYLEILENRLDTRTFDAALVCNSLSAQGFAMFKALEGRCPRILIPHSFSMVSNWNFTEIDPSFRSAETITLSFNSERFMVECAASARVRTTGSFLLPESIDSTFLAECRARGRALFAQHGVPDKIVVFYIGSVYTNVIAPAVNPHRSLESLREVLRLEPALADRVHFVTKAKSEEWDSGADYLRSIAMECSAEDRVTVLPTSESIFDISAACDFAIGVNVNTSGYLYPILLGRPLIHLEMVPTYNGYGDVQTNFYLPDGVFETVTNIGDMHAAMARLALDARARNDAGERGRKRLQSVLPLNPSQAFRKVVRETVS